MKDRRRSGARERARPTPRHAEPIGGGFVLSTDAKAMLRAIRQHVDANGVFRETTTVAASLAKVTAQDATRALDELARKGMVRLQRASARPSGGRHG